MLFVFNQCKTIANACNGNKTKMSKLTYVQNGSVVQQKITKKKQLLAAMHSLITATTV